LSSNLTAEHQPHPPIPASCCTKLSLLRLHALLARAHGHDVDGSYCQPMRRYRSKAAAARLWSTHGPGRRGHNATPRVRCETHSFRTTLTNPGSVIGVRPIEQRYRLGRLWPPAPRYPRRRRPRDFGDHVGTTRHTRWWTTRSSVSVTHPPANDTNHQRPG